MLQAENTDLFNPLVPSAHNSESQNLLFNSSQFNERSNMMQEHFPQIYEFALWSSLSVFLNSERGAPWAPTPGVRN